VFQKGLEMVLQICVFGMGPFGDMHLLISIPRANPNSSTIKAAPLTVVTAWWSNSRPSWGDTADMTRHRVLLSSPPQACGSSRSHRGTSWCICSPNTQRVQHGPSNLLLFFFFFFLLLILLCKFCLT
jgi:hypothetical protein